MNLSVLVFGNRERELLVHFHPASVIPIVRVSVRKLNRRMVVVLVEPAVVGKTLHRWVPRGDASLVEPALRGQRVTSAVYSGLGRVDGSVLCIDDDIGVE